MDIALKNIDFEDFFIKVASCLKIKITIQC